MSSELFSNIQCFSGYILDKKIANMLNNQFFSKNRGGTSVVNISFIKNLYATCVITMVDAEFPERKIIVIAHG